MRSRNNKKYPRPPQDPHPVNSIQSPLTRITPHYSPDPSCGRFPFPSDVLNLMLPLSFITPICPVYTPTRYPRRRTSQVDTWTLALLRCFQWLFGLVCCTIPHAPFVLTPDVFSFSPRFCLLLRAQPVRPNFSIAVERRDRKCAHSQSVGQLQLVDPAPQRSSQLSRNPSCIMHTIAIAPQCQAIPGPIHTHLGK